MGLNRWRAAGAAVVCLGAGTVIAASPATAMSLRSSMIGNSAGADGFPDGEFLIQSAFKGGQTGTAECVGRSALKGNRVGGLHRSDCNTADDIWTYHPETRQIRLAADPKLCAWGFALTAPCDPTKIPAKEAKKGLVKKLTTNLAGRVWYRDDKQRLYVRMNGNVSKPFYLATESASINSQHRVEAAMVEPQDLGEFQPEGLVWHLVPPTAASR